MYKNHPPPLPLGFGNESDSDDELETDDFRVDFPEDSTINFSRRSNFSGIPTASIQKYSSISDDIRERLSDDTNPIDMNAMEEIEALVEQNMLIEKSKQLVPLDDSFDSASSKGREIEKHCHKNAGMNGRLPRKSIIYDYMRLPLGITEQVREFMPQIGHLTSPFLRPIIIDGLGLIKAYWECCSDEEDSSAIFCERTFPFIAILRCLFYWISRGHFTQVCFPIDFSPVSEKEKFRATDEQVRNFKLLETLKMVNFFEANSKLKWFTEKRESMRACMITSVAHFLAGMPSEIDLDSDYKSFNQVQTCPDGTLQPYFGLNGDSVFFSPISGGGKEFVLDLVLDDKIKTEEQFRQFEPYQLNFIDQAKQLKMLYDYLPAESRIREAHVMVALVQRLEYFL